MTDKHVCPVSDGPKPHVGGVILPPCETTVLIGFLAAARMGDKAECKGPPNAIAQGSPTVFIGGMAAARMGDQMAHGGKIVQGEPTVIIGDSGGGGGGGGGGGAGGGSGGGESSADEMSSQPGDGGGTAASAQGASGGAAGTSRTRAAARTEHLVSARWERTRARVGDPVRMTAATAGIAEGSQLTFCVYERGSGGGEQQIIERQAPVTGSRAQTTFQRSQIDTEIDLKRGAAQGDNQPLLYYFRVRWQSEEVESDDLVLTCDLWLNPKDHLGQPFAGRKYVIEFADGTSRTGQLGEDGDRLENVPAGPFKLGLEGWNMESTGPGPVVPESDPEAEGGYEDQAPGE